MTVDHDRAVASTTPPPLQRPEAAWSASGQGSGPASSTATTAQSRLFGQPAEGRRRSGRIGGRIRTCDQQVVAYWTKPEDVLLRSFHYQQAAAKQFRRNLDALTAANLGEETAAALKTLSTCAHEVTERPDPDKAKNCDNAFATVRATVKERRQ